MTRTIACILLATPLLPGCGSALDGNPQVLQVLSNPDGARCEVRRGERLMAVVEHAPGTVMVPRNAESLDVTCALPGIPAATEHVVSRPRLGSPGEVAGGGTGGRLLDTALLRDFHYPGTVMVTLAPARAPYRLPLGY